jgi:hypothetical protein
MRDETGKPGQARVCRATSSAPIAVGSASASGYCTHDQQERRVGDRSASAGVDKGELTIVSVAEGIQVSA